MLIITNILIFRDDWNFFHLFSILYKYFFIDILNRLLIVFIKISR